MDDFKNCMNEFSFMQFFLGRRDSHEKTNFYRLSQNKLVILPENKRLNLWNRLSQDMEREDFDIRDNQLTSRERDFENALRPLSFEDFSGQDKVVDNLRIFVKAARLRGEALDHVLLHGPPGWVNDSFQYYCE